MSKLIVGFTLLLAFACKTMTPIRSQLAGEEADQCAVDAATLATYQDNIQRAAKGETGSYTKSKLRGQLDASKWSISSAAGATPPKDCLERRLMEVWLAETKKEALTDLSYRGSRHIEEDIPLSYGRICHLGYKYSAVQWRDTASIWGDHWVDKTISSGIAVIYYRTGNTPSIKDLDQEQCEEIDRIWQQECKAKYNALPIKPDNPEYGALARKSADTPANCQSIRVCECKLR